MVAKVPQPPGFPPFRSTRTRGGADGPDVELQIETEDRRDPARRVHRSSVLANVAAFAAAGAALAVGAWFAPRALGDLAWWLWPVVGPLVLLAGGVFLLVVSALGGAVAASLRPTNWLARTGPRGLELNLRSYLNARPGDALPVLRLEPSEIRSIGRVGESWTEERPSEKRYRFRRWLELDLGDADTSELARVLDEERRRTPAETSFAGIRSRTKHHHEPVRLEAPGRLWVEWRKGLFADLERTVPVVPPRRLDRDQDEAGVGAEERARRLWGRGSRVVAVELLVEALGLSREEAKRRLEGERPAA